jgi:hypothetical protein
MVYDVRDLTPEQKRAAELLLGGPVSENESVRIERTPPSHVSPEQHTKRLAAYEALVARFASRPRPEIDPEEEEAAVLEAMRSVRPNYRPVDEDRP